MLEEANKKKLKNRKTSPNNKIKQKQISKKLKYKQINKLREKQISKKLKETQISQMASSGLLVTKLAH